MQLTLVSHYGPKSAEFGGLIGRLQRFIAAALHGNFRPYALEQVHATIAGLEGSRAVAGIWNENFLRYRNERRCMGLPALWHFLRKDFSSFEVRIGGFRARKDYGFTSQSESPFTRSFSIQNQSAVVIGWPYQFSMATPLLDDLRRHLQGFGVLHKWHRQASDVDNDLFFVIGHVGRQVTLDQRLLTERRLRDELSAMPPCTITIERESLAFVAYSDATLPLKTSRVFWVTDPGVTPELLQSIYG